MYVPQVGNHCSRGSSDGSRGIAREDEGSIWYSRSLGPNIWRLGYCMKHYSLLMGHENKYFENFHIGATYVLRWLGLAYGVMESPNFNV